MGFFDLFRKKKVVEKPKMSLPDVEKVTIPFPTKSSADDYSGLLENVRSYFGKLYKSNKYSYFHYNTLGVSVKEGVYFGYTKYNGETNRNGTKAIDLCLPDDTVLVTLDRKLWKRYDKEIGADNAKWLGYSDGDSVRITVFKDKVPEGIVTGLLGNYGGWIADSSFNNSLYKMVEQLNLNDDDFEYKKKDTGRGYDYYYNNKYMLAGVFHYVNAPFVSLGFAKPEPENTFNNKAVAIYTDRGVKVGYISERELNNYHSENSGIVPIVMEAHYYKDRLYGNLYTFTNNIEEYGYISNQFSRLLNELEQKSQFNT